MKSSLTALVLAPLAITHAQSAPVPASVTLYGLIDAGVEHVTNVGPSREGVTRLPSLSGTLPSRWGLRGTEALGGGLHAVFTLESGFAPDTGASNQGGRLFGRQALVALSGDWGTVSLGRQYTMLFWALLDADQLGPNNYSLGSLDSYLPNSRADNAIAYRGTFNGLTVGAVYSLGRDTVNAGPGPGGTNCAGEIASDKGACRLWSALLKYDTPAWGVALAADELRGGVGAFAGLVRGDLKDQRITVNGYVKLGPLKLSAGVIQRDNDGAAPLSATNGQSARSHLYWLGGAYAFTQAFILDGQVQRLDFKDGGDQSTLTALRGIYNLSKRSLVYAQLAHIGNGPRLAISVSSAQAGSNPLAGGSQNAVMVGVRHSF
jgi:predicted porin